MLYNNIHHHQIRIGSRQPPIMSFYCFSIAIFMILSISTTASASTSDSDVLMSFKEKCVESDPKSFFTSWTATNNSSTSPCSWNGVICSTDHQITALNLTNAGIIGHLLDMDLLMPLPNLKRLYLRGNFFSTLSSQNGNSCNLDTLDLSSNNFSDPIHLSSCTLLTSLNLSRNSISSTFTFPSSLRQLDLSRNHISDLHLFNHSLHNFPNLIFLNLSDNKISGNLPPSITTLSAHLSVLDLSYNLFTANFPSNLLLTSLTHLDLSHNNFSGKLSNLQFKSCENLTLLNLSHNSLVDNFSPTITNCHMLQSLDLSHNILQHDIPSELGNLKSLQQLSLAKNEYSGGIPQELGFTCGTLQYLDLSGNKLVGGLPSTFVSCSSLQTLNLGTNLLSGDFLTSVVSTITSLTYLYVPFNNITGSVPQSLINCTHLRVLDLSSNAFTGNVPSWLCPPSTSLQKMLLPNNYLTGTVPYQLGDCNNLKTLDLSFNYLNGSIPDQVWELPNLTDLVIWANSISGEIPDTICGANEANFETLILNNNFITGTIPQTLARCTNLIWVSLSNNRLTGEIPIGIGNLKKLAVLQLGNNSLTGEIPHELGNCEGLIWLDLNSNQLTGSIPPELTKQSGFITPGLVSGKQFAFVRNEGGTSCRGAGGLVEFEGIRTERLAGFPMLHSCPSIRIYTGMAVYSYTSNGSMIYLDLSYNDLSGSIPDSFGSMSYLQVLNMGHNGLTGNIPDSFGDMKEVGVLDLSHNYLQGYLPGSLGTLSFLSDLDVSNNNLTGPIPSTGQLTTFPSSRYENNSGLCGVPLPPCGSSTNTRTTDHNSGEKNKSMALGVIIGIILAFLFALGLTFALYGMNKSQHDEDQRDKYIESLPTSGSTSWKLSGVLEPLSINIATFEKPLRKLTFAHLLEATNGFSSDSLIGSGGFGEVYKARLKDGSVVAIKKLIQVTGQGEREFTAEMETIGKIKHRNLVPLLGYCKIGEERLLVYEYMKWGSLEMVLHDRVKGGGGGGNLNLDWAARKKIAIGSARGLAFLHHSCIPHIIHRDMKSSNVLLDENLDARVSDFGMARLMNALDTHLSVSTLAGTPGYVPPEYYQSFRCTTKGDVYSYGVVLLELLSGKRPIDPSAFGDDNNLVGWAKQLQREKTSMDILDPELIQETGDGELYQYLKIAFQCLEDRPFRRPTMIQVMAMFKELQMDSSESDILDGFSVRDTVIEEKEA